MKFSLTFLFASVILGALVHLGKTQPSPPTPATQFLANYEIGVVPSGSGSDYRPFVRGALAFDAPRDDSSLGAFIQFTDDNSAPFLLTTSFILTPQSQGYQAGGDGRCWAIGDFPGIYYYFILSYLNIPPDASYVGTQIVLGQKCTVWQWYSDGYNITAAVRISDSAMIFFSDTESGISLSFENVVVGKPDDAWFAPPLGPCLGENADGVSPPSPVSSLLRMMKSSGFNFSKFIRMLRNLKPVIPEKNSADPPIPQLAQIFTTDYVFGIQTASWFPIFTGHVGLDYPKRNVRFVLQDDQDADMPFILSSTTLLKSNDTNNTDLIGYQFLDRGSCWATPSGFFDWLLQYDFSIPSYATFQGNVTINGINCEVWYWQFQYESYVQTSQRVSVDPTTGAFYQFEIIFDIDFIFTYEIDFLWKNTNMQLNNIPANYYTPPPGCLPWD